MTSYLDLPGRSAPSRDAGPPLGTWLKIPAVVTTEIMAFAGFDFVVIDLEHSPLSLETAYALINLSAAGGIAPLVRVPDHSPSTVQRVLDAGAHGVLIPHVDTVEQARAAARSVRFPPRGDRGAGGTSRAGRWGQLPTAQYLDFGNSEALCVAQLESAVAIAAAAEILAVEDVSAVLVGAADLALSIGAAPGDPVVTDLVARAMAAAAEAGKPCGLAAAGASAAADAAGRGAGFVVAGNDSTMLATAARDLVTAYRDVTEGRSPATSPARS